MQKIYFGEREKKVFIFNGLNKFFLRDLKIYFLKDLKASSSAVFQELLESQIKVGTQNCRKILKKKQGG